MDAKKINVILDDFEKTNPELYNHSERVAMICYAFAKELNLSFPEREIAYFSGMLHDIAKYYLGEDDGDEDEDYSIEESALYIDKEFSKLIPVIGSMKINLEEDLIEKYGYNVNIIRLILMLANTYDELRIKGLTHEKTCEKLRQNYKQYNGMVTSLLKTIIKNRLNYEY